LIKLTSFLQFHTKTNQKYDIQTFCKNRQITKAQNIKFPGIIIDSNLSWRQHIDDIIPNINKACFAIRSVKTFVTRGDEIDLFFLFSLCAILWDYILGQFSM
jgi:hypothetical protein